MPVGVYTILYKASEFALFAQVFHSVYYNKVNSRVRLNLYAE